jgi:bacitracin synthase 1
VELSLITKAQKEQKDILVRFYEKYNNVEMDFPDVSLTELFVKAAKVYPKKIAVSNGSYEMNYEKLNILSDKVAFYLNNKGVKKGDLVYIDATRSIDTIVGILGILKVGAAYVPVDPEFPEGRKEYIKTHSKCTFELYTDMYEDIYKTIGGNALEYSKEWSSDALAYVIYTSGSTGQPKGVAVTHKEAVNTILDINSKFHINENDKIIGISSLSFDLSVYDIFVNWSRVGTN